MATGHVGANHDAIANFQRDAFKVLVPAVSSNGSHGTYIFVALVMGKRICLPSPAPAYCIVKPW